MLGMDRALGTWSQIKNNAASLKLDYNHDELVISNEELLRCIDVLKLYIPDTKLSGGLKLGALDFIQVWTDQILTATSKESFAAVAIITAVAHAFEAVEGLPRGEDLLNAISRHNNDGLFNQLIITYLLVSESINVIAVEQGAKARVDILAEADGQIINIHVKSTDPDTKSHAQFEAHGQLTQARLKKPIMNAEGKFLEFISFDGYIPVGIPKEFWVDIWGKLITKPVTSLEIKVPDGDKMLPVRLDFSWEAERHGLKGSIKGVNAFQTVSQRIKEVNTAAILAESQDIELLVLVNEDAEHFWIKKDYLASLRIDGVMSIGINPGALGYHFKRSKPFLKNEYEEIAVLIEQSLPEAMWLC